MNRVAIAFSTCDRVELTKRSIEPLLQPNKFDLWWCDGSKTVQGIVLPTKYRTHEDNIYHEPNIRGGSGPAIVYALTTLLRSGIGNGTRYDYIGLVENDVLLDPDWFEPTMALFDIGIKDGLQVGAVSARCYEDRILIQRNGYAICHNLGAGMVIFSRKAADLVLQHYRTTYTTENRLVFAQLSGIDIGSYWAFRGEKQFLVADWGFDKVLASHGLASLALTPNKVKMLDQDIGPLGLKYADGKPPEIIAQGECDALKFYRERLEFIRNGELKAGVHTPFFNDGQNYIIFAHQVPQLGGTYVGDWRVRDFLPFGPFVWKAGDGGQFPFSETPPMSSEPQKQNPSLLVSVSGPVDFIVSGGKEGGKIKIEDEQSGYEAEPFLPPELDGNFMQISVPGSANYRNIKLTAMTPGVCFFALKTREPQPYLTHVRFDYSTLPLA